MVRQSDDTRVAERRARREDLKENCTDQWNDEHPGNPAGVAQAVVERWAAPATWPKNHRHEQQAQCAANNQTDECTGNDLGKGVLPVDDPWRGRTAEQSMRHCSQAGMHDERASS
jgi:hypothetical protein